MIRRQKSSRQFGVCGSALERAPVPHKTSRIRRSRSRRLKRPLAPARRSAAVCGGLGSRAKKEPKKAYRDFQAIRRKGVVQGQSRQALMSWRRSRAGEDRTTTPRWRARPRTVLSRRGRPVSRFGKNHVKSTTWTPSTPPGHAQHVGIARLARRRLAGLARRAGRGRAKCT